VAKAEAKLRLNQIRLLCRRHSSSPPVLKFAHQGNFQVTTTTTIPSGTSLLMMPFRATTRSIRKRQKRPGRLMTIVLISTRHLSPSRDLHHNSSLVKNISVRSRRISCREMEVFSMVISAAAQVSHSDQEHTLTSLIKRSPTTTPTSNRSCR